MKIVAGAVGGLLAGACCGWILPLMIASLFAPAPHGFESFGISVLQWTGLGIGATVGFITGGAWSARRFGRPPPS
jgi:hypothetical protein